MELFDAHIYSDERPDVDFANLAYFGVGQALLCAHSPRAFQTARDLWQYFESLVWDERERLGRLGVLAHVALGIHPRSVPRRAHYEIWRELPFMLGLPEVAALGELSVGAGAPWEWSLVERQLRLLGEHDLGKPVVFSLPRGDSRLRRAHLISLGAVARACGVSPARILVQHIDWLTIDTAEAEGFVSGLSVHPAFLSLEEAVKLVLHHDRRRLVASSAMRAGAADVLALPKLALALSEAGIPRGEVERVVYGNAMALFVRAHSGARTP